MTSLKANRDLYARRKAKGLCVRCCAPAGTIAGRPRSYCKKCSNDSKFYKAKREGLL